MSDGVTGRYLPAEDEIDLREYAAVIWRSRWLVAAVVAVAVAVAAGASFLLPPVYRVESVFALPEIPAGSYTDQTTTIPQMPGGFYTNQATAKEVLLSSDFLRRAAQQAGLRSDPAYVQQIRQALKVEPVQNSTLMRVTLETPDPAAGEALIRSLIDLYGRQSEEEIANLRELLRRQLATVEKRLGELEVVIDQSRQWLAASPAGTGIETRFEQAMVLSSVQGQEEVRLGLTDRYLSLQRELASLKGVRVVQPPETPLRPVRPRPALNMAVAGVLGLMASVLLAFGREYWRRGGRASTPACGFEEIGRAAPDRSLGLP